jgi:GAF domain-containing protein
MDRNHSGYQYLEQEQRRQTEYLASLHETALGLITRRKLTDLLQSIVDRACALLDLTNGFIYLCQPGDVEMELGVGAGYYHQHLGHRVRQDQGFVGKVWRTGRSQVMDYAGEGGLGTGMGMPLPQPKAAASIVGVPLRSHDQILGVLGLAASGRSDAFQFEEISVLSQFARLASIAIDNARLYDQAQAEIVERKSAEEALERRATQLSILNEIGSEIAVVLRLESVLDKAVHLVQERLGYHHVAIFTVDLERDELVMQARAGALSNLFPPDHSLRMDEGIVGWVASHGQALTANDVSSEPHFVNRYPELICTRAELAVPIVERL